jgi:acid phosphatase
MLKKTFQGVFGLTTLMLLVGCQTTQKVSPTAQANFNSTLWVQTAAEYKANAIQAYNAASQNLATALIDVQLTAVTEQTGNFSSMPPAIIFDVDETVLDNSQYQAQLLLEGRPFKLKTWDQWLVLQSAPAVPGAVEFINLALDKGVEIFYITNRECLQRAASAQACPQKEDTIKNLSKVGIKYVNADHVMLKNEQSGWVSEKHSRRLLVVSSHRVVMQFGDDLGDFLSQVKNDITVDKRAQLVAQYAPYWGTQWFVFSNPTYGSWLRVLDAELMDHLKGY